MKKNAAKTKKNFIILIVIIKNKQ